MKRLHFIVLVTAAALGGCSTPDAADDSRTSSVRDSAGVHIAFSAIRSDRRSCVLGREPALTIGSSGEDETDLLYRVNDAARLADGRIAVVHGSADEVRIYDADGSYDRSIGRSGNGPGEFSNPMGIDVLDSGEMWIGDAMPFRFNVFDGSLDFSRTVAPRTSSPMPPMARAVLGDGRPVLGDLAFTGTPEFEPDSISFFLYGSDGERIDTLGRYQYGSTGHVQTDMTPIWFGGMFEPRTQMAVAGRTIAIGYSGTPEVRIYDPGMRLHDIIRWEPARERTVTDDDVERFRDDVRERYSDAEDQDAQSQDFMRQQISPERPVNDLFPAFNRMKFGRDGRLWLEEYARPSDSTHFWMVFDEKGSYTCTADLPESFSLFEAGADYILGRDRDPDTGVEQVHLFDLTVE
jgi:hypothetical protein